MIPERIIGKHIGEDPGPLLICLAGVHGNEPAGVKALESVFQMLKLEYKINPGFRFQGMLLGLRGNRRALKGGDRYMREDLNRLWTTENVEKVRNTPVENLEDEDLELRELVDVIYQTIDDYQPASIVLMDIHTTSAHGGIFTLVTDDPESHRIGIELHAPVITGMLAGLEGTTLHYFVAENFGIETTGICFEAGQHEEPNSVKNAIAAIINCMRSIECVSADDVENKHDELLIRHSQNLPKVAHLIDKHNLKRHDKFFMLPGYRNFQKVEKNEVLAFDKSGAIRASEDALILMPFYQRQGEDGFFLIKLVEGF
ncbi:MAG: succinylglutamate desuccinylase/aspartoacylase family protein [Bacteroidota bacterium]